MQHDLKTVIDRICNRQKIDFVGVANAISLQSGEDIAFEIINAYSAGTVLNNMTESPAFSIEDLSAFSIESRHGRLSENRANLKYLTLIQAALEYEEDTKP